MGQEVNIGLIMALERRIEDGEGDIIKLKRARNSLLNISTRMPPEILGIIFAWIVTREQDDSVFSTAHFAGLEKGSHNFLLVCHRWLEVASRTPVVWTFWGKTLEDWGKRCHRVGGAPVDLLLDRFASRSGTFHSSLRDALRDRAARDGIRQIHFASNETQLLGAILSSLIPNGEDPQERDTIESIALQTAVIPVELSHFFLHSHLPNLRSLRIRGFLQTSFYHRTLGLLPAPLWDRLTMLRTTRLTTLSLYVKQSLLPMTSSHLLPILVSNPSLREFHLSYAALPNDADEPPTRVPLPYLRTILLEGGFRRIFGLLNRLELPAGLNRMVLRVSDFTAEDVLQTLGPYMRDHFQRDIRFQGRLTAAVSYGRSFDGFEDSMRGRIDLTSSLSSPPARFSASLIGTLDPGPAMKKLTLDLLTFIPREHVTSLEVLSPAEVPQDLLVGMPNIEALQLCDTTLSDGFLLPEPEGPHANKKLLPSLRHLHLENVTTDDANWGPLIAYLTSQTLEDQDISLQVSGRSHMPPEVVEEVRGLVGTFIYDAKPDTKDDDVDQKGDEDREGDEDHEESDPGDEEAEDG